MVHRVSRQWGRGLVLLAVIVASVVLRAPAQTFETMFYMIDREECIRSFEANIDQIDIIGPQTYYLDGNGILWGSVDRRVLDLARKRNIKVMPLVMNPEFDQPMLHALLHDPAARERAVQSMVKICVDHGYAGLQFDFENIHISDRDAFTSFYRQTAEAFRPHKLMLSIAVVPRISDEVGPTSYHKWIYEYWRGAYDYRALAEIGDFISLMTYDQHSHRTPPGPVAGLTWMEKVIRFVLNDVPAAKISLGIPFYSYYWHPFAENGKAHVWGRGLDHAEAVGLAERHGAAWQWNDREKVFSTFYEHEGLYEHLYLEDARSFEAKLELLNKYGFRGISVWRLGHEDPKVWDVLRNVRR